MFYAGESNVPGAPGNLLAGSPGYFLPETDIQQRMQERYYQTPAGQKLRENINRVREKIKQGNFTPGFDAAFVPGSSTVGAIGNVGGIANAQFFNGPQYGQVLNPINPGLLGIG